MAIHQLFADPVAAPTTTRSATRFSADLYCMHCARLVGTWEWATDAPQGMGTYKPLDGTSRAELLWRVRCPACGGPVYADEAEPIREREIVHWGPEKRGRKPKKQAA